MLYISTSPRIGPFVLGFIAAYFIQKLKQKKIVLSKVKYFITYGLALFFILMNCTRIFHFQFQIAIIFFTTSVLAILSTYYRKSFNVQGRQYNFFENALYASFSRSFIILPFVSFFCIYYGNSVYLSKSKTNSLIFNWKAGFSKFIK